MPAVSSRKGGGAAVERGLLGRDADGLLVKEACHILIDPKTGIAGEVLLEQKIGMLPQGGDFDHVLRACGIKNLTLFELAVEVRGLAGQDRARGLHAEWQALKG